MRRRSRALVGAFVMVGFVVIYALTAMTFAQAPALQHASGGVQALVYAVLGMAWIVPLLPLIRWIERRDSP